VATAVVEYGLLGELGQPIVEPLMGAGAMGNKDCTVTLMGNDVQPV